MQVQMIVKVRQTKTEATAAQGMSKEVLRPTEEQQAARIPETGSSLAERACARGYSREESVAPTVSSDYLAGTVSRLLSFVAGIAQTWRLLPLSPIAFALVVVVVLFQLLPHGNVLLLRLAVVQL